MHAHAIASATVLFAAVVLAPAQESRPAAALNGLDPVELCGGREVAGAADAEITRGAHRYRFASAANRAAFDGDPARYEIQWGGACGRMGPRSGAGDAGRFAVHDGRIWIFASPQCRAAFLKAPEKFLDPDDAPPRGDDAARTAGAALIDKMVVAVGGAARLDGLKTCDALRTRKVKTNDGEREDRVRLRLAGGKQRLDEDWGNWSWTTVVTDAEGFTIGNDDRVEPLHPAGVRDFRREMVRNPLSLLRARKQPGFVAVAAPAPEGSTLTWVEVGFAGTTTAIGIDPASGDFRETRHRGRGPSYWFGAMVRRYSDTREVGGLRVPHRVEVDFDGKTLSDETRVYESIRFDVDVPDSVFARPSK